MQHIAHAHRLRLGRFSEKGRIYLVTMVCHQRAPVFSDFASGRCVVAALRRTQVNADTLCYVVMPDHVHWLMQLADRLPLSQTVQSFKADVSRALHRQSGRQQPVWMSGFHEHALRKEEDLAAVARYVVANPLRAGLVDKIANYPLWDAVWL